MASTVEVEAIEPTKNLTLYDREEHLQALYNTLDVVEPGMEDELKAEIQKALTSAVEKRERIIHMIQDEEDRIATAKARIKGFQQFVKTREAHLERFQTYVASVIKAMGTDGKGKYPVLKGITGQLSLRKCPDSVTLTDEAAVPAQFKTVTVTMPLSDWEDFFLDHAPHWAPDYKREITIDKKAIKAAIESGHDVAGADISFGDQSLVVK